MIRAENVTANSPPFEWKANDKPEHERHHHDAETHEPMQSGFEFRHQRSPADRQGHSD